MPNKHEVIVTRRVPEALGVVSLELAATNGQPLPAWSAGSHIDLAVTDNSGSTVQRQYSLCGPPDAATWQVAVLDAPDGRGGARWLHTQAVEGFTLRASAPRNHFGLHAGSEPAVLVAGGIGITPILAMSRELQARGTDFELHYYARSAQTAAFLGALSAPALAARTVISLDALPVEAQQPIAQIFAHAHPHAHLYVCGPQGFMDAVTQAAQAQNFGAERIHRELFAAPVVDGAAPPEERPFDLVIRSTGRVVHVASGTSAVSALAGAGIDVVVSCEQGLCGSCLTPVLEGLPEHRDQFMLPEEQARNDCFTPCCSRALSARLVLDL